ncbi:Dynamitin [Phaffia rhodozyma]|uniref:Dynamitin n=1 Tax=Phaffia rhodozyma TaxID=264483 RepID=A0A0F7SFU8_PHARH|nr:Dynamitin [Phaffia rhodozyma]
MSSKYADLPDIDTAPDVYETEDVPPERIQYAEDSDDDIINPTSARAIQKAKDAQDREYPDESPLPDFNLAGAKFGALAAKTYSLYPTPVQTCRNPTLAGPSLPSGLEHSALLPIDDEPPRARLRRLRFEMSELEEQLTAESSILTNGDDRSSEDKKENNVKDMLRELKGLVGGLNKLDADGARLAVDQNGKSWEDRIRVLGQNLENARGLSDSTPASQEAKKSSETVRSISEEEKSRKVGEIDRRLAELESAIGVGRTGLDDTQTLPAPLLPTVQKLDHLLTLLTQPRHLDAISRRIKLLLTDLDRAQATSSSTNNSNPSLTDTTLLSDPHNRRSATHLYSSDHTSSSLTVAQIQKIDSLSSMLPKIQPILPILPPLLARLHSLSDIHSASSSFGSTLTRLESEAVRLKESSVDLKAIVDQMEGSLKENETRVEGNFRAIGERVGNVLRRVEALER